jgi:hypothetical protein
MDWNAITAIASAISMVAFIASAVYVRAELKHGEKSRYLETTNQLFSVWQTADFMEAQLWLLHRLEETTWEEFVRAHRADYGEIAFHRVGSFYDRVGTLVRRGFIDEEEILSTMGPHAIAVWQKIEPLVQGARRVENSVLFDDFERLLPACLACYVPGLGPGAEVHPFNLDQRKDRVNAGEVRELIRRAAAVSFLDLRRPEQIAASPRLPPGTVQIALAELPQRLGEVPPEGEVIAYCA